MLKKIVRLILNICITLPFKIVMFAPIVVIAIIVNLAGYEDAAVYLIEMLSDIHF